MWVSKCPHYVLLSFDIRLKLTGKCVCVWMYICLRNVIKKRGGQSPVLVPSVFSLRCQVRKRAVKSNPEGKENNRSTIAGTNWLTDCTTALRQLLHTEKCKQRERKKVTAVQSFHSARNTHLIFSDISHHLLVALIGTALGTSNY